MTDTPTTPHTFTAIRAVMADVRGVAKSGQMEVRGKVQYHFQRFEDMAEKVGDAFRAHGIFPQSEVREFTIEEWEKAGQGGSTRWARARLVKRFTFTSLVDGSTLTVEASGEGSDNSDKATNKAETSALKNALRHGFLLSTRDEQDPDATRPDDTGPQETARNARQQAPGDGDHGQYEGAPDPAREEQAAQLAAGVVDSARSRAKTKGDINRLWSWAKDRELLGVVPAGELEQLHVILRASGGMLPDGDPSS